MQKQLQPLKNILDLVLDLNHFPFSNPFLPDTFTRDERTVKLFSPSPVLIPIKLNPIQS